MTRTPESRDGPSLLYIAGYGRSGSTMLGRLLAQDPSVLNLGEVALAAFILHSSRKPCPCGAAMGDCPVWKAVARESLPAHREVADAATHKAILETIAASQPTIRTLVDSSKSCWGLALRAFQLRSPATGTMKDVRVIHLIRDPRGVVWSQLRDSVRRGQPLSAWAMLTRGLRTAVGWLLANLAAELYGLVHPKSYTRLTYEQLMASGLPPGLQDLGGPRPPRGQAIGAASGNNHDLGGNRLKRRPARQLELDEAWRDALPKPVSALVAALCWPLMLRYGHLTTGTPDA